MNYKFLFLCLFLNAFFSFKGKAQLLIEDNSLKAPDVLFNRKTMNPVYAGDTGIFRADFFYKRQWLGYKDGPRSFEFSSEGHLKSINSGIGIRIFHGQNGAYTSNNGEIYYNFRHYFSHDFEFRIGTSLGLSNTTIDREKLSFGVDDPSFLIVKNYLCPLINIGVGFNYKNHNAGLSYSNIFPLYLNATKITFPQLILNYEVNLIPKTDFTLQPEVMIMLHADSSHFRSDNFNKNTFCGGLKFRYKEYFQIGSYVTNDKQIIFLFSGRIFNVVDLGYIFYYRSEGAMNATNGYHSIRAGILINKLYDKIRSRY